MLILLIKPFHLAQTFLNIRRWNLLTWAHYIELLSVFSRKLSRYHLKTETDSSPRNFAQNTGRWIMSKIVIVILIYHHHKPVDRINLLGS
jgi:hypothetical protein